MRLDDLDLNLILALESILRLKSVSAAADEMNLTQPALSKALSKLRTHFGDRIVVPVGRNMIPTEFGLTLLNLSTELLLEMRVFSQLRPSFDPFTAKREFSIITSDYIISVFLTQIIRELVSIAPNVTFRLMSIDVSSNMLFDQGKIDFSIVPDMAIVGDHPHVKLFEDEFVCIAWDQHPDINNIQEPKSYLSQRHVTTSFGSASFDSHFEKFLKEQSVDLNIAMSMPNFTLLPECIIGTPFIATIHKRLAEKISPDLPIVFFPTPIPVPVLIENLQWHSHRKHDVASIWMRNFFVNFSKEMFGSES